MQSQRELSTFPLSTAMKTKLRSAGFLVVNDITNLKPSELSKETGLSLAEALEVINTVLGKGTSLSTGKARQSSLPCSKTALEMLQQEQGGPGIVTFSQRLDAMLGGGVPVGKITEFCGAPGVGKTQLCMQLCADVQMPGQVGGLAGEAVYVDTEGSFVIERYAEIARETVEHCHFLASTAENATGRESVQDFTLEKALSGLHYFSCHDCVELLATIHQLPKFLQQHPQVKLIVVDSIAFHFRHDFDDMALRTRILTSMAQSFIKLAVQHQLAVVLTNQMTTRVREGETSQLVPALGESWGHAPTIRVVLYWQSQHRYALLYKSPSHQELSVPFAITMAGIRDVHSASEHCSNGDTEDGAPAKRQRVT